MNNGEADATASAIEREAQGRNLPFKRLDFNGDDSLFDLYEAPIALIRPDHIIAWRGDTVDPAALFDKVTGRLSK